MNFRESPELPGIFYNAHFPELYIHRASNETYLVTHHGEVVRQAQSLFGAIEQADQYLNEGGAAQG